MSYPPIPRGSNQPIGATDALVLSGSATKTVRVTRIAYSADATAAGSLDFYFFKRTTADTGGTSSVPAAVQMDSRDPAPTASAKLYSANPSALGTGVLLSGSHYAMPAASSTGYPISQFSEDFGSHNERSLVLRTASEALAVNFNGQTIPAGTNLYLTIEWTEE